ncbi:Regulator of G-protein signaling 20 [Holothuria leucospilota]|uniref:Regulator of G-protein signaling 20 n=1 Tax=Holothuria leucospilota TaxID=206669 RepID=A0A9Q1BV71_HOLLE|nr:Regulator of G-protein signaling 20 [Holothuria leucospilota]
MTAKIQPRWRLGGWPLAREYQLLIAEMRDQQRITRETTPPSSPVHHEHEPTERTNTSPANVTNQNKGSKACCFCWCCCCSCSCLTMRNTGNNNAKRDPNAEMLNGDANETPTLEEIRSWAQSFDAVMKSARGRKKFREFLRSEYSEENLMFWLACEDLQKESNSACVEEKARLIYEDFISILSPKEVSLDSKVREAVNLNMTTPDIHTFDEAQQQIYILMHRDSFPRFVNSKMFRNLMEAAASKET